jgi:hypothetical protein
MSQRAVDFVHMWISANIHPQEFIYDMRDTKSKKYAAECRKHAVAVGISVAEMRKTFDDLETVMAGAMEKAVEQESKWAAQKDD